MYTLTINRLSKTNLQSCIVSVGNMQENAKLKYNKNVCKLIIN